MSNKTDTTTNIQQRIEWIEIAKAIGIMLIVLGHSSIPANIGKYIYSFHVPLFFFLSGYLFDIFKYKSYGEFLKKKIRSLLIPYAFFSLITYLFWVLLGRHFGDDANLNINILKPFIGIFYSNGIDNWLQHATILWFITCLFVVENFFYFLTTYFRKDLVLFLALTGFGIIGAIDNLYMPIRLPWGMNIAFTAVVFYGVGNILKRRVSLNIFNSLSTKLIAFFVFVVSSIVFCFLNKRVDMNLNEFHNFFYFYISAMSGIFVCILMAQFIPHNKIMSYMGNNSFIIMALHSITFSLIKGFQFFILKIPLQVLENNFMVNLFYTIVSIILLFPIIYIINTYLPFIMGRKKKETGVLVNLYLR